MMGMHPISISDETVRELQNLYNANTGDMLSFEHAKAMSTELIELHYLLLEISVTQQKGL